MQNKKDSRISLHTGQFEERADQLSQFSDRMVRTAKMVAVGTGNANKKVAEAILAVSGQIESMTPQLINAGRIRMVYPENKAADEHFNNLKSQYSELLHQGRAWLDEVTDSKAFISRSLKAMQDHADHGNIFLIIFAKSFNLVTHCAIWYYVSNFDS